MGVGGVSEPVTFGPEPSVSLEEIYAWVLEATRYGSVNHAKLGERVAAWFEMNARLLRD